MKNTSYLLALVLVTLSTACGGVAIDGDEQTIDAVPTPSATASSSSSGGINVPRPPPIVTPSEDAGQCLPCATHPGCQGVDCEFIDAATCEVSVCTTHFSCTEPC